MKTRKRRTRHLVCPECGEAARRCPPRRWVAATGPRPRWSHPDGEPLCPVVAPTGYRPADPRPAPPVRWVRRRTAAPDRTRTAAAAATPDTGSVPVLTPGDAPAVIHASASVVAMSDLQTEALREVADPIAVGGEADWEVAVFVYALPADLSYPGCTIPAGVYVRTVRGKWECAYPVPDAAVAVAYAEQTEQRYTAWAEPSA